MMSTDLPGAVTFEGPESLYRHCLQEDETFTLKSLRKVVAFLGHDSDLDASKLEVLYQQMDVDGTSSCMYLLSPPHLPFAGDGQISLQDFCTATNSYFEQAQNLYRALYPSVSLLTASL